ncbi:demethylmenaquinone methyltransferase / 2-methoxy-6-polyprenyl-1,4-benzoquinol methylase [Thermanaeromonas toyohensis ToBE]|uniref:Demethylmenaquinone methyltransferase n=1 Tax=Thermanaeromonas toyohensis ToBE TaxID=698762 RepID=A0A1W1VXL0_9FIRM|nr:demethylmenaquinone methyltransferase [Thermanaeromonas toyohensis]SMB98122.1 demethylmenaquinone methyltransferase / 2-methoxy-6-polyprenyl-1,4-benzoquinol methylase [Thermanaeromonas toyohensis ToBE]
MATKMVTEKEVYVRRLFSRIARRYDLMNTLLSFNLDKYWRRVAVEEARLKKGDQALDVCCGTGMLTLGLAQAVYPHGKVVGLDFCPEMLEVAKVNLARSPYGRIIELVEGNAVALPFEDNTFDCATIAFALRNVPDIEKTLREMQRVVRPGGRVISLELAKPSGRFFKQLYYLYFNYLVPLIGRLAVGDKDPYSYLPRSLKDFPHQEEILKLFTRIGLKQVNYRELTGGIVAIHVGVKI